MTNGLDKQTDWIGAEDRIAMINQTVDIRVSALNAAINAHSENADATRILLMARQFEDYLRKG